MKLLKDENYLALKQASDNYNTLVKAVIEGNPDMKAEEVTVDVLAEAMQQDNSELKAQLESDQNELKAKDELIAQLQSTIKELKNTPAEPVQEAHVENEPVAVSNEETVKEFADSHKGETLGIMKRAKESGFFNIK